MIVNTDTQPIAATSVSLSPLLSICTLYFHSLRPVSLLSAGSLWPAMCVDLTPLLVMHETLISS